MIKQIIFFVMLSACNVWVYGMESAAVLRNKAKENEMNKTVEELKEALDPLTQKFKNQICQEDTRNKFCDSVRDILKNKLGILTDGDYQFYYNSTVIFGYSKENVKIWMNQSKNHKRLYENLQQHFKQCLVLASLAVGGAAFCAGYYYAKRK